MLATSGEIVVVGDRPAEGKVNLADGRQVDESDLWPVKIGESLAERLASGDVDPLAQFALRLDSLYPVRSDQLLLCTTELTNRAGIDRLVEELSA